MEEFLPAGLQISERPSDSGVPGLGEESKLQPPPPALLTSPFTEEDVLRNAVVCGDDHVLFPHSSPFPTCLEPKIWWGGAGKGRLNTGVEERGGKEREG